MCRRIFISEDWLHRTLLVHGTGSDGSWLFDMGECGSLRIQNAQIVYLNARTHCSLEEQLQVLQMFPEAEAMKMSKQGFL